jgi:hypothetical protein
MSRATDVRIKQADFSFEPLVYRAPLKFGGRVLDKSFLIECTLTVESRDGKHHATGFGSMPVGNIWAWPSTTVTADQAEAAMKQFAEEIIELAGVCTEYGHPIDLSYHLSAEYDHTAKTLCKRMKLPESMPELAQLVAASPFDAALHDAYGRLHDINSYDALTSKYMNHDLAEYLDKDFAGEYLDQYTPLYHLVGALDPLTAADVTKKIGDGLPETLAEWIPYNGLTHMKIKLSGEDFAWDIDRVLAVDRVATEAQGQRGCAQWFYSLDFNEKCANVDYVVDFLKTLGSVRPCAVRRTADAPGSAGASRKQDAQGRRVEAGGH